MGKIIRPTLLPRNPCGELEEANMTNTRGGAQDTPATSLISIHSVSFEEYILPEIGKLCPALESLSQTVCSLGGEEARRNDDEPMRVLHDIDIEPDQSPSPTAMKSIAE